MPEGSHKWNRIEKRYRQRRKAGKPGWTDSYARGEQRLKDFLSRNHIAPAGKFLELGCGAGNLAIFAAKQGFEAYGIDFSPEAIDWACAKARESEVQAQFKVGDIVRLDVYPSEFFDIVYDGAVVQMVVGEKDRAECFSNIFRILKRGGLLCAGAKLVNEQFKERHEMGPGAWYDPAGRFSTLAGEPAYYLSTEDEFRRELEQAGFTILRLEKEIEADAEHPFWAGGMEADARKPATTGRPAR